MEAGMSGLTKPPTGATRTVLVWISLMALFTGLGFERTRPIVGGILTGAVGSLGLAMVAAIFSGYRIRQALTVHAKEVRWPVTRSVLVLVAVSLLAAGAMLALAQFLLGGRGLSGALVGTVGVVSAILVVSALRTAVAHRTLAQLDAELATASSAAAPIEELQRWSSVRVFYAFDRLLANGRSDVVALLTGPLSWSHNRPFAFSYRVRALVELGRIDEARTLVDGIRKANPTPRGPEALELLALLHCHVAVAERASISTVCAELDRTPATTNLAAFRLEVLANAYASTGDREKARQLLAELASRHGASYVRQLLGSTRPSAALAGELLAETSAPFR